MKPREYTPEQQAFVDAHPHINPTCEMPGNQFVPIEGVTKVPHTHVAVKTGAMHKGMGFMDPIHSADLEKIDGHDWELFSVNYIGMIKDQGYVWGMFVEGIGAFNVMVPIENIRKLTPAERETWSKKRLGMYGSHTGNLSTVLDSGVTQEA